MQNPRNINVLRFFKLSNIYRNFSTMDQEFIIRSFRACIPPMDATKHKGQAGRIGVVGGSLEYTGAPYFSGIAALKVGADLVHIFCTSSAATVIKSYSPELIVHPLLDSKKSVADISPWFDRLHAIVIGPGLGRETNTFQVVSDLFQIIKQKKIPLVIDADGLFLITENPDLIKDFKSPVVLTPNKIEFERFSDKVNGLHQLGNKIIILKKGSEDNVLSNNTELEWKYNLGGSGRRCGGQGDLLSGSIATFLYWTLSNFHKININTENKDMAAASIACYAASVLIRKCNEKAFKCKGRSMLATDMIQYIHESFEELYGQ